MSGQLLDSGRPVISWETAATTGCYPSTQVEVCFPPAVLELVFGIWNLFSGSCFSSFLCIYFPLYSSTLLSGTRKSLQMFLLWSLLTKLAGVRTAFISLKFQVPVGWVCMPWVITKAEKKMMCVIIYILHVELSFCSPMWVYPQLENWKASHSRFVYLTWKSCRQNTSISVKFFKVIYQKIVHSFIHTGKEDM